MSRGEGVREKNLGKQTFNNFLDDAICVITGVCAEPHGIAAGVENSI